VQEGRDRIIRDIIGMKGIRYRIIQDIEGRRRKEQEK